ncbi:ribosomal RNA-processing protein 7-domain-containing protein [Gongronella butleri]|nr:ribosomal RNA-processing protein 7-domain-containing protein [Gongronella butleri]
MGKETKASKTPKALEEFFGYKVLPVIVKEGCRHFMYMTRHQVRSEKDSLPGDRTLFLANLPIDTTDEHLQHLFRSHGKLVSITYRDTLSAAHMTAEDATDRIDNDDIFTSTLLTDKGKKRKRTQEETEAAKRRLRRILRTGASAHIVFHSAAALDSAMEMTRIVRHWDAGEDAPIQPLGFQRYVLSCQFSRPDHQYLQQQVDAYMLKFKQNEYQKEREAQERLNKMDDDGFVVVSRFKRKRNTDGEIQVSVANAAAVRDFDPSKTKKKELVDFYRFQLREKKQNELADLRKRFEQDKAKISQLKQARKFKPY